jgi:hypothetical protein
LITASEAYFGLQPAVTTQHTISATITMLAENVTWSIRGVYGLQTYPEKRNFLQEIRSLKQSMKLEWLIRGDFNLIYRAQDKNNDRINLAMINRFKRTIDDLQLLPLEMHGRRFTWCNDQQSPTISKIDHLLACIAIRAFILCLMI